jgi:hypothetical protein
MYLRMLQDAPIKVTYAGITYQVELATIDGDGETHIVARPLTADGRWWEANKTQQLSLSKPGFDEAKDHWSEGFEVNDQFFLPHALAQQSLADQMAAEIDYPGVIRV